MPNTPPDYVHIMLSSFVVYIFIIFAIRLFGKKELSQLSVIDLVFILLISNAVQNAMVGPTATLSGGLIAATTLFLTNYIFKFILYKFPKFGRLIQGSPLLLIYKGKLNQHNLNEAKLTFDELKEAVREHGVKDIEDVDLAVLEVDGNISVLSNDFKTHTTKKRKVHRLISKAV